MARLLLLFAAFLAAACAHAPAAREDSLLADASFARPATPISASDVFAVSEPMRRYLREEIAGAIEAKGRQRALYDALYSRSQLKLEYDSEITRNAAEAFAVRAGNCLSLVIMTAALARELGLEARFEQVSTENSWSRAGGMYFAAGHVTVSLARRSADPRVRTDERVELTVDFIPPRPNEVRRKWPIEERTIVAMYMNNRAAESLARGKVDDAYWWAREAVVHDATFHAAYNTLAVVYRHRGDSARAERALRHVLALDAFNPNAMANLALVYADQGRHAEARVLTARLETVQPQPPLHFFNEGRKAMERGDFLAAKLNFAREIERDAYYHEFHFWFAAACLELGETELAKKHLALAQENSPTRGKRELYSTKLDRLR